MQYCGAGMHRSEFDWVSIRLSLQCGFYTADGTRQQRAFTRIIRLFLMDSEDYEGTNFGFR